jgi:hypothetical protein
MSQQQYALPDELFRGQGLTLLAEPPLSQIPVEAVRQVIRVTDHPGGDFVPVFTSTNAAAVYVSSLARRAGREVSLEYFHCNDLRLLGLTLTLLAHIGHTHLAIDPDEENVAITRIPIGYVESALHERLFPGGDG